MNIQITNLFQFTMLLISIACPSFLLAQANTPPTGSSTNLCPKQTYRYTSAAANDGGLCNRFGGWKVENGKITSDGVGSNNSIWADVQWDNVASGKIGNFCGVLTVSINSIAQPTISGSSTVSLCGSGSITLQASVSSTTNITGYVWNIVGTGVSPTGLISTTAPQITINYANWAAGSSLSATVAVGTKNSCGFTTRTTPLVAIDPIPGIPNSGEPAIPRSAWVQLSPGNIDNLLALNSFTPGAVCSSTSLAVVNLPTGSSVQWSSANQAALTINSTSGFAQRQNSFTGGVSVSAVVSNACGSKTITKIVALGVGIIDPLIEQKSPVCIPGTNQYEVATRVTQPAGTDINNYSFKYFIDNVLRKTTNVNSTTVPAGIVDNAWHNLKVEISNLCGSITTANQEGRYRATCSGGGGQFRAFPNPANTRLTIEEVSFDQDALEMTESIPASQLVKSEFTIELINAFGILKRKMSTDGEKLELDIENLPNGVYYIKIGRGYTVLTKQVLIKH
jgi:hypothetical protein